jgi:MATE family multidrug resistance protein
MTHVHLRPLAVKLSLAQLAPMLASLYLAKLVARHGTDEFSAYAIVTAINITGFIAVTGFLQSLYYLCGRALGMRQPAAYGATLSAGLIWALVLGALCTLISMLAGPAAARAGVAPVLRPYVVQQGLVAATGLLPATLLMVLRVHATMQGGAGLVTAIYVGGGVTAVVAGAALAPFGAAGVLCGVAGTNWLMLAAMLAALRRKGLRLPPLSADAGALRGVFAMGWPTGAVIFLDSVASLLSIMIVARFWLAATPLHAAVLLCISVGLVGPLGLAQAAVQHVSILHAAGDGEARDRTAWSALRMAGAYGAIAAVCLALMGGQIASAFGPAGAVPPGLLHVIVLLGGVVLACQSVIVVAASALRGLGVARAPLLQALIGYGVVAAGCELLLGVWLNFGPAGVWWGLAIGFGSTAAALLLRCAVEFAPRKGTVAWEQLSEQPTDNCSLATVPT